MSHECLHKRPGGQVGLVLETYCKKGFIIMTSDKDLRRGASSGRSVSQ